MKLVDCNIKIRCEIPNCKDYASYKLTKPGFVKNAGLFLCKSCVKDIYTALGECVIPKSPSNMLQLRDSRSREQRYQETIVRLGNALEIVQTVKNDVEEIKEILNVDKTKGGR